MTSESFTSWRPRRIGILGAGAMGTSLAAIAGRAVPVVMVCRNPDRAAELFRGGAATGGLIEASSRPIVVGSPADLEAVGGVSALFVATKTTAIPHVARDLRPLMDRIGDQPGAPFIVSYQNGIESGRHLMGLLGDPRVLRMVLNFGAVMRRGGAVEVTMHAPPHTIGCVEPEHVPVCGQIAGTLTRAGLPTEYSPDLERHVWHKGLINACMSPVAALVDATIADVLDSPARRIVDLLLAEGLAVARAEGIDLGDEFPGQALRLYEAGREHTPSMVEDIRAGRESEVGQLNRQVIEHAGRLGIPVPTHEVIDALIETFDWRVYERTQGEKAAQQQISTAAEQPTSALPTRNTNPA